MTTRAESAQPQIHVVGIGLDGSQGLNPAVRHLVQHATLLVGSRRHLSYFPDHAAKRLELGRFDDTIEQIRSYVELEASAGVPASVVVLASGDPLFFGIGRLLLMAFPAPWLAFYPHLSSVQLAFSRLKLPWQEAELVSAHGRSLDGLLQVLQQGANLIAVLTDSTNHPLAIAHLLESLDLRHQYQLWVCENLGGPEERLLELTSTADVDAFAPLNVVVLKRLETPAAILKPQRLPLMGLPDSLFFSFRDRPNLMTKREVRVQILGELALQPEQVVWDIGAGTGSVAVEIARLCPSSTVYAIEQTAAGAALVQQNSERFAVANVMPIQGSAPEALQSLPDPDRIFVGGSGGQLAAILDYCRDRIRPHGQIVLALATLEHLTSTLAWLQIQAEQDSPWSYHLLQVQIARSVGVAHLTRLAPLNPITLVVAVAPG